MKLKTLHWFFLEDQQILVFFFIAPIYCLVVFCGHGALLFVLANPLGG
jgi:hypothetical protein